MLLKLEQSPGLQEAEYSAETEAESPRCSSKETKEENAV